MFRKRTLLSNGLELNFIGNQAKLNFILKSQDQPSEGIQVLIDDPAKIVAASQFRLIDSEFNTSETLRQLNMKYLL